MENDKKQAVQEEALRISRPLRRRGLGLSMGVGKTKVGLMDMHEEYESDDDMFLVAAPKLSIFDSWEEEAVLWGFAYLQDHIDFTTYLSLDKIEDINKYKVIYLDECHSLLYTHDPILSQYKGKILGLTGTEPKWENSEKGKMVAKYCPIVFSYITDEAVGDGILNDYRIFVHMVDLDQRKNIHMSKGGRAWFTSEQETYDYWTKRIDEANFGKELQMCRVQRMKAMQGFKSKELVAKPLFDRTTDKAVMFANTQEQADRLCQYSYHSKNPKSDENLQKFKAGEITKLSCVSQLNEGVNIPDLKEEHILHAYSNERKTSQRIGRGLRLDPGEVANIHIYCYRNTVDERWTKQALEGFDQSKITYI